MESRFLAFVHFFRFGKFFLVSFIIQRMHGFAGIFLYLSVGGTCYDFLYSF